MSPRLRHLADRLGLWAPGWRARQALRRARAWLARTIDPEIDRHIDAADRRAQARSVERDNALRRMDDLAVRILSATLTVGKIGMIDLDLHRRDAEETAHYHATQVDELLDAARTALFESEDVARYATLARRQAQTTAGPDPVLNVQSLRGAAAIALRYVDATLEGYPDDGDLLRASDVLREALRA